MSGVNHLSDIRELHIELTDRCQASCPMCARNINGGAERPFVGVHDISLENFKSWFPEDFLSKLDTFLACGNYGDPIIARDCLEIFQFVRSVNKTAKLSIHTNGSARSEDWWKKLSAVMVGDHLVTFGIDGFEASHMLYRRGTDWNKIISNAKAFIKEGGTAEVDCLVFKHNQEELNRFQKYMLGIGFQKVNFKYTRRFYDMEKFPVEDNSGKFEYYLEPACDIKPIEFLPLEKIKENFSIWKETVEASNIIPKCVKNKSVYVDSAGNVSPCCWVGSDLIEQNIPEKLTVQKLRNKVIDNSKNVFKNFGIFNLTKTSLTQVSWNETEDFLKNYKPWTCVKNCNG